MIFDETDRRATTDPQFADNPTPVALEANQHVLVIHGFPSQAIQKAQQIGAERAVRPFPVLFGQGKIPNHIDLVERLARQDSIPFTR